VQRTATNACRRLKTPFPPQKEKTVETLVTLMCGAVAGAACYAWGRYDGGKDGRHAMQSEAVRRRMGFWQAMAIGPDRFEWYQPDDIGYPARGKCRIG
jgi:hypothetical protein